MAIYSDDKLNSILEKADQEEKYSEKVKQNIQSIKDAKDKALGNAKKHIDDMAFNATFNSPLVKKKKKPVKETFTFDKDGNLVDRSSGEVLEEKSGYVTKTVNQIQNATDVEVKRQKLEKEKRDKYNQDHPVEYIARKTGSVVGTTVGATVGGVGGAVTGATVGTAVGGVIGGIAGGVDGGKAVDRVVKKGFTKSRETAEDIKNRTMTKIKDAKAKAKRESFDYRNVCRTKEFTMAMEQYFDITDNETRQILLAVNEEDQSKVLVSLTSKLYDSVMDKVDDIDFGEIPLTKGDITRLSNFNSLVETHNTMRSLLIEFKQDTEPVDTISKAISNIIDSTNIWKRAYAGNVELPIVLYNTIVLSIIEATSYMLSMCIEFIKNPSQDTFQVTIDKSALNKSKNHMLFDNLRKFNEAYRKNQVQNAMEYVIKENVKNFGGMTTIGVGASIVGIAGLLFCIIPIIRELIFLFYYTRVRVSEFFDVQSDLLQMSAYNVENNRLDLTKEQRKQISSKQMKVAERFRVISNKIAINMKESEVKATKDMTKESKKYKVGEVMDEIPDSAGSSLF